MIRFHSNIERPRAGWMRFRFSGKGGEIDLQAPNTPNDPFYELVTAIQAVHESGLEFAVVLNEEPEKTVLKLGKSGDKLVLTLEDENGRCKTQIEASFHTGCREISRNIYHLFKEVGYNDFVKEWRHSPPRQRIKRLWETISS